jgi:hypothetical protein
MFRSELQNLKLALPIWHGTAVARSDSSEEAKNQVEDDGQHYADYDAGYYGKEELKSALLQEYVPREPSQEGKPLPEDQQQTQKEETGSAEEEKPARTLEIHATPLAPLLAYHAISGLVQPAQGTAIARSPDHQATG